MLSKKSVQVASVLSQRNVVAYPNSIIDNLQTQALGSLNLRDPNYNYLASLVEENQENDSIFGQKLGEYLEAGTAGDGQELTAHSSSVDEYVRILSEALTSHLSFARNEVKPAVVDAISAFKQYLQTYRPETIYNSLQLVDYTLPEILRDEHFLSNLSHVDGKAPVEPEKGLFLNGKSAEDIRALIKTHQSAFDELIVPWLDTIDVNHTNAIYNNYFTKNRLAALTVHQETYYPDYFSIQNLPVNTRTDVALMVYLMANTLQANPETTESNISLSKYKLYLEQIKDWAASVVWSGLKLIANCEKTGTLVLHISARREAMVVVSTVYEDFLRNGGSIEALMGLLVSNRNISNSNQILAERDKLLSLFSSHETYYNSLQANATLEHFKSMVEGYFNNLTATHPAIVAYREKHADYDDRAAVLLKEFIKQFDQRSLRNIDHLGLELVAKIAFHYSNAYQILKGIEDAFLVNPNIDVREAALLSAITCLADFMASMIEDVSAK